jgi:hypothetical protein
MVKRFDVMEFQQEFQFLQMVKGGDDWADEFGKFNN